MRSMLTRHDPRLKGKPRGIGTDRDEVVGLDHNTIALCRLLPFHIAEHAAFFEIVITLCPVDLFLHRSWHDRQCDELRVRMFERCARRLAVILEEQNIPKRMSFLRSMLRSEKPKESFRSVSPELAQTQRMFRRFNDHLMRAYAVHLVEHAVAFPVKGSFDPQRRKLVRHNTDVPSGWFGAPPLR